MGEVRAKKALGQHFLVDLNIARKICDALSGGTAEAPAPVLEVGCGMGVLTQFLLRRSDVVVWGAEIDAESVDYLRAHYREVAERIACPPGSKEYGILSVLLQAWYDIEYLFTVGEKVFNPPPKVKSAVIRLRRNGVVRLACDERLFVRVVKASFGQRRKMLRNSLRAAFGDFGGAEHPFFSQRAEQLSVADFVALTQWVEQRIGG